MSKGRDMSDSRAGLGQLLAEVDQWFESKRSARTGLVTTNVMWAGLFVAKHLASACPLQSGHYRTDTQIRGGASLAEKILRKHGEHRVTPREAGRTSRRTVVFADELVAIINAWAFSRSSRGLDEVERRSASDTLQRWFVVKLQQEYFDRQCITAEIDPRKPVQAAIHALLVAGRERGGTTAGAIAQHVVGASLSLQFPNHTIVNESYTTGDRQTARAGDFQIGDAAIHVTMQPSAALFSQRCQDNLHHGFRPVILVPRDKLSAATQLAELEQLDDRVAIQPIEDFVGMNMEELAGFDSHAVKRMIRKLLETYNARVSKAEADASLRIDLPENL